MAKKGLGKGLNSLFNEEDIEEVTSEITKSSEGDIKKVRMSLIEPNKKQPRRHFDEEKITALADSIKEHGLIQPIIITPSDNNMYKIVAGERRWRAAKKANLKEIPAVIRKYSEEQVAEIALIENLQRENLNPIEEAIGYNLLMDEFNLTQELISQRVGKSRSAIANSLRLLSLEDEIQKMLILGTLTSGHARAILSLDDKELRDKPRLLQSNFKRKSHRRKSLKKRPMTLKSRRYKIHYLLQWVQKSESIIPLKKVKLKLNITETKI